MHVHVAPNFDISLPADAHSLSGGVTTAVDAGSIGAANFSAFKEAVVDRARVRVLAYLNIVDLGMGGEFEQETAHMDPERPGYFEPTDAWDAFRAHDRLWS